MLVPVCKMSGAGSWSLGMGGHEDGCLLADTIITERRVRQHWFIHQHQGGTAERRERLPEIKHTWQPSLVVRASWKQRGGSQGCMPRTMFPKPGFVHRRPSMFSKGVNRTEPSQTRMPQNPRQAHLGRATSRAQEAVADGLSGLAKAPLQDHPRHTRRRGT